MHGPAREVAAPAADVAAGGGYGALMLTSLVVLVLVCVVAWVALRVVARWLEGRRMGGGVSVVARVPLEPRRALYVVEAGGRRLLIGSSEGGVSLVTELDAVAVPVADASVASAGPRGPRSFAELLQLALGRRREPRDVT
jgi:flagellar biosynthetic protein FliO